MLTADDMLTEPERLVVDAASTGALVDLRVGDEDLDDVVRGDSWDVSRTVRAALLVDLLIGTRKPDHGTLRALKIRGARITGLLDLEAATVLGPLTLRDCYLEQPVNLNEAIAPSIRLPGSCVPGIDARQLHIRGSLELDRGFISNGEVMLVGAQIDGALSFEEARLNSPGGRALGGARLTVHGTMLCDNGFTAQGEVSLLGAHIGGELSFAGASLNNPGGRALRATRIGVDGPMNCNGLTAQGEVSLTDGHVSGLTLSRATLNNPRGKSLRAARLTVDQAMFCRDGFTSRGEIILWNAHIGLLAIEQANLTNSGGMALDATNIVVDRNLSCINGSTVEGQFKLFSARIGGRLSFGGARFTNPDGTALNLERMTTPALYLLPSEQPDGAVDLVNVQVGYFYDDPETWPARLRLRGFVYDTLENDTVDVRTRLSWLLRDQDGYRPQPYDQLAGAYKRAGREEAARQVKITKEWRRRRELNPLGKLWNWLLYVTVGYGYRTWKAAIWLVGLLTFGTWVFTSAYPHRMAATSTRPATFHPVAYTLDVLLPIVDLSQQRAWAPQGTALYWSWALSGAGWVLTTAVVAGLTGILKRE